MGATWMGKMIYIHHNTYLDITGGGGHNWGMG